jgi:hypothetical protein
MQNLIKELEQGTVIRRVSTLDLRAARAIRELYTALEASQEARFRMQEMKIGPSLQECKAALNEVVSEENLGCID